jgi:Uma2 family endonuclease
LRCTFGGRSIVPDLAIFENHRVPNNDGKIENVFTIAPDWTIEVLSPGQSVSKVLKNINHCLAHGAQMGWLIDPNEQSVIVSRMDQNTEVIDEPQAILPVPDFAAAIELSIEQMFKWLNLG